METTTKKIGIIAGNGSLPVSVAQEAKRSGFVVIACAIHGETDPSLSHLVEKIEWVRLGQIQKLVDFFKKNEVKKAVMVGKITKTNLLKGEVWPDIEMIKMMANRKNSNDDTLLSKVANYLDSKGIQIISSTAFLDDRIPKAGVWSKRKPSAQEIEEIEFGWEMAKAVANLDIGQTVVTKDKAILAVEAIEGTDEAILRGGALGFGGVTVVKVAKPNQDMRFDVPTIGLKTLDSLVQVKAKALAFEAGKTIVLDQERFMEEADRHGIIVVAREDAIHGR